MEGETFAPYSDSVGIVVRLSNEASEPFRYIGLTPGEHPPFRAYLISIRQFPDVRSCLSEEEEKAKRPDLRAFDWEAIDGSRDADVCIFRVASSYQGPSELERWFEAQGFRVLGRTYDGGLGDPLDYDEVIVHASWNLEEKGFRFRGSLRSWLFSWLAHSLSVAVTFDRAGSVRSVKVLHNTK